MAESPSAAGDRQRPPWPFRLLWLAVLLNLLAAPSLTLLCASGRVYTAGNTFVVLFVLLRVFLAQLRRETGYSWVFYLVLLFSCYFWMFPLIQAAADVLKWWRHL